MARKLPDFLGIGAMRAGSTLLYDLLKSHPDIYVPPYRKEVRYFDEHYDRGEGWYESFFDGAGGQIAGEITPTYLYSEEARKRIKEDLDEVNLLVILRDPVERAYSHFKHAYLKKNTDAESFEAFLEERPDVKEKGLYGKYLAKWSEDFGKKQLCVLRLDNIEKDVEILADYLDVTEQGFNKSLLSTSSNASFLPYSRALYSALNSSARHLRRCGLDLLVEKSRPIVDKILSSKKQFPPLKDSTREVLKNFYQKDSTSLRNQKNLIPEDFQ